MAARYLVSGGTGNWNSTTNWSATSGGASGASFPVSTDDVIFDINSANTDITVNVSSACLTFIASDYTGIITFTSQLACSGNFTFSSGMTTAGTSVLLINATATITSNGVSLSGTLRFQVTGTVITLADDWVVAGLGIPGTSALTVNGFSITNSGSFTLTGNGNIFQGTTNIIMNGTGTISNNSTSGTSAIRNNLTFNTGGTITISGNFRYDTGILTYISGTIDVTGSTLIISTASSVSIDADGIVWENITFTTTTPLTCTLLSNLTVSGTLLISSISLVFAGAFNVLMNTLSFTTGNNIRSITFVATQTYTITGALNVTGNYTSANHQEFKSSIPGTKAFLVLNYGATQDIDYCDATDIDSSGGQTIYSYAGTISNSDNWKNLVAPEMISNVF